MKKMQLSELLSSIDNSCLPIYTNRAIVFRLKDGRFLKQYNREYLSQTMMFYISIEDKILDSAYRKLPDSIKRPEVAVYNGDCFWGEISSAAKGVSYGVWEQQLNDEQLTDLGMYADVYSGLEGIVKSTPDIIYPDICSYDNIFISDNGKRVELIDYEGLQVGDYPSFSMSSALGDSEFYDSSKKYCSRVNGIMPLYTKELDKRSLIFFYFRTVFNIDLRLVDQYGIDLDTFFNAINLNDQDVTHKVWKLFQENEENEWLDNDVFRIAEDYKMKVLRNGARMLVRK